MSHTLRETTLRDLPALHVEAPQCTAALSLYGGQLLSFVPHGGTDVLWLSPRAKGAPNAIRGGVPVCWPYFARDGQPADAPQHGIARTAKWTLDRALEDSDGNLHLSLSLPEQPDTPLRLYQTLVLGTRLQQALTTRNPGGKTLIITQALHSYFAVGDAQQARISGVAGLDYVDKYTGITFSQSGDWTLADPRDPGRSDRIFHAAGGDYMLHDPALNRRLRITTTGSRSVVVWNPGQQGARTMADVPDDGWRDFICVESANAGRDFITLAPGANHTLAQTVAVLPLA